MESLDRSFDAALDAVLQSGLKQRELGSRRDNLLKKLVNIGYENQFSPDERVKARKDIREAITTHLGQRQQEASGE